MLTTATASMSVNFGFLNLASIKIYGVIFEQPSLLTEFFINKH